MTDNLTNQRNFIQRKSLNNYNWKVSDVTVKYLNSMKNSDCNCHKHGISMTLGFANVLGNLNQYCSSSIKQKSTSSIVLNWLLPCLDPLFSELHSFSKS